MASWLATMTARRAATSAWISTVTRCASSLIPRRGLAGIAAPPRSPSKWKKGHSLIISVAGCGLLSFGGYKLFTGARNNSTNYAKEFLNVDYTDNKSLMDLFELWIEKNGKTYKSPEEKMHRSEVFKANVKYVEERNKALTGTKVGLNHFSDLDREDFVQARYLKDLFEWWIENVKGMSYESPEEKLFRFECFRDSVKFIEEMNKELISFRLGLTPRADVGYEEPTGCRGCRMDRENLSWKM